MKPFSNKSTQELINLGLFSVSLIPLLLLLFIVVQRIGLPIDFEWGEGAGINQIYRILSDDPLYTAPALEFMPLVYTPVYYWLAALAGKVSGEVVLSARLLSFLASLGTAGLIIWFVVDQTKDGFAGWLAGGLFLACYGLSDGFYDLVRVDSFYVLLLFISLLILRLAKNSLGLVLAGLSIALGFFTKQSAVIVFLPLILYLLLKEKKGTWPLLVAVSGGIVLPYVFLNLVSEGWFAYYTLKLPQQHGYSLVSAVYFWVGDLLGPLGIAVGFGLFYSVPYVLRGNQAELTQVPNSSEQDDRASWTDAWALVLILFAVGAIGAAWITRASNGGGANNAMSAFAAVAMLFGLGYSSARSRLNGGNGSAGINLLLLSSMVAIQYLGLIYNPFNFIPTAGEIEANQLLLDQIENLDDSPWIPYRSHLPRLVGKPATLHAVNLFEVTGYFKGDVLPEGLDLVEEIRENICQQAFGLIILDQPIPYLSEQVASAYEIDGRFSFLLEQRSSAVLDWQGGYQALYVPRASYDINACLATVDIDQQP